MFDRDKKRIKDELGIDLMTEGQRYFIDESDSVPEISNVLDYYEMFSVLYQANELPEIFLISERKPRGLGQINSVVNYINKNRVIEFNYKKYDSNEVELRTIEPLAIKESRERWYLIGNDYPENKGLRAFAFDRIDGIKMAKYTFLPKYTMDDIKAKYNPLYAMFDAEDQPVEIVELKFDRRDGLYIQSFPIHPTQKVMEIESGFLVNLELKITPDFIMEIMSRAWSLEVIKPITLRQQVAKILKEAYTRNH